MFETWLLKGPFGIVLGKCKKCHRREQYQYVCFSFWKTPCTRNATHFSPAWNWMPSVLTFFSGFCNMFNEKGEQNVKKKVKKGENDVKKGEPGKPEKGEKKEPPDPRAHLPSPPWPSHPTIPLPRLPCLPTSPPAIPTQCRANPKLRITRHGQNDVFVCKPFASVRYACMVAVPMTYLIYTSYCPSSQVLFFTFFFTFWDFSQITFFSLTFFHLLIMSLFSWNYLPLKSITISCLLLWKMPTTKMAWWILVCSYITYV